MPTVTLKILVLREGEYLVGQALEYDIAAQGRTMNELHVRFQETIAAYVLLCAKNGQEPFKALGRAPEWYWEKFKGAMPLAAQMEFPKRAKPAKGAPAYLLPKRAELAIA